MTNHQRTATLSPVDRPVVADAVASGARDCYPEALFLVALRKRDGAPAADAARRRLDAGETLSTVALDFAWEDL